MYKFKEGLDIKISKTEASKVIGITREYLSYIMNRSKTCSKPVAYCIAKFLNEESEISDYFDRVS